MHELKPAILLFCAFTLLCGGLYPAVVTGVGSVLYRRQAQGSLLVDRSGRVIGSSLIGQPFTDPKYFWPRPSATAVFAYNPEGSGGSNAGPTNPAYLKTVAARVEVLRKSGITGDLPAELVQASASGLDPHLSPEGARLQIPRVARVRGLAPAVVADLVAAHTADRQLGIFGVPRINVLELNLALDRLSP